MAGLFPDNPIPAPKKYPVNGYAAKPGTGPDGKRCKDCEHCAKRISPSGKKTFYKCRLMKHAWTNGYGSDIRANSPACREYLDIASGTT